MTVVFYHLPTNAGVNGGRKRPILAKHPKTTSISPRAAFAGLLYPILRLNPIGATRGARLKTDPICGVKRLYPITRTQIPIPQISVYLCFL